VKGLRKKYPRFASYNENICCPTRPGLVNAIEIFSEKYNELEAAYKELSKELNEGTIGTHWIKKDHHARKKNIEKLYCFIKQEIETRLKKSEFIINILSNLSRSDIFWDRIKSIDIVEGEKYVYDITIPDCHNFIANGIFVHNSNIIDALTFVLGTTSARTIRAQKLQNLLFNGARDKKPADFCEVSLYLDNKDKKIPGEDEMKITRKITRSGISIYKISGHTVTRAKVLDILSYANLYTEGYNIIMQGDVTKIIEMSPIERRSILDEISGITEFDDKKQKASQELEKVEVRVKENMIIVAEKQRLVERLREEKETAEKYLTFSEELKKSKASLVRKKLDEAGQKYSLVDEEIKKGEGVFKEMEVEFNSLEKELEKKEKGIYKKSDELIKKSRNYEIQRKIDEIKTEIIRKNDRIDLLEREVERLKDVSMEKQDAAVKEVLRMDHPGVCGTFISLISVPKRYDVAMQVAIGKHANDIVVENDDVASECVRLLKEKKIGRARFLPLNKIRGKKRKDVRGDYIGWAYDLVKFEKKYTPAVDYVLGSTIVAESLDKGRRLGRVRVSTLDGDLIEASGAIIGGYFKKRLGSDYNSQINQSENEKRKFEAEILSLEEKLKELESQLEVETKEVVKIQEEKSREETEIEGLRKKRKELYEERLVSQSKISKLRIEKAKLEATIDNLQLEFKEYKDVTEFYDLSADELQEKVRTCIIQINRLGPVNMRAIEEYNTIGVEFEEMKKKLERLLEEKDAIVRIVNEVEKRRYGKFMETMTKIRDNFARIYHDLTNGIGILRLDVENNIDSGLVIEASPLGKKVVSLDAMSGGEKTLTSLAFLFSIMQYRSAPFYVLDEIDAALDKSNTKKIANLIKKYSKEVQFVVISHNDLTIQEADKVFGVSIEDGVSKVFGIDMTKAV
ncbi:MAG: AAA family ATPase, partial [Candidatus Aenigmarchaeota archaeon]|nr:AAA family ATPase [Candidatus Aenigmarchaeota archaeon]MDI6722425.1 AAA family ATPase [Candidatus Aenigmarchaeota archaeon]